VPGSVITLGPEGIWAQPLKASAAQIPDIWFLVFMFAVVSC
jgi:hypothetical protein